MMTLGDMMGTMDDVIRIEIDPPVVAAEAVGSAALDAGRSMAGGAICRLPLNRSAHFTGRDRILAELSASLHRLDRASRTQALVGLAGIGKTQIALEHAHRCRDQYTLIWWLRADEESTLNDDYTALARELFRNIPDRNPEATRDAVRRELERRDNWLLVFDGSSDPTTVAACVPSRHKGNVLITSRNPNWRGIGGVFPIPPMDRNESISFLSHRSGRSESILAAGQLAKALGDLPLALEQAAALIEQTRISFSDYLRRLERHWGELLSRGRGGPTQDSIALSLEITFSQLEATAPASAELLNLLAFVAPEGFEKKWLANGAEVVGGSLAGTVSEPFYLDEALGALLQFSLIDVNYETISIHRIVAALARSRMSYQLRTDSAQKALRLMDASFNFDTADPRTWPTSAAMLPHALAAVEHAQQTDVTVAAAATLLNRVGQCLFRSGRYEQARVALDRGLAIGYRIYGEDNPRLSAIANNLGRVLMKLGDLTGAREQFEWALTLDEKAYGPSHPHVAEVQNNYGLCLARLDQPEQAREQFESALRIYEGIHGPNHPNVATILNNLGFMRLSSGDLTGAWELLQRALGAAHGAYGPNHPDVASILLNLGDVLRYQGSHSAARAQYTRALTVDEIVYGPLHPDVARDLAHLGDLLVDQNEAATAKIHFTRALQIDEAVYGINHPNLNSRLTDLGHCLKQLGEIDAAVDCFTRAAAIREKHVKSVALNSRQAGSQ